MAPEPTVTPTAPNTNAATTTTGTAVQTATTTPAATLTSAATPAPQAATTQGPARDERRGVIGTAAREVHHHVVRPLSRVIVGHPREAWGNRYRVDGAIHDIENRIDGARNSLSDARRYLNRGDRTTFDRTPDWDAKKQLLTQIGEGRYGNYSQRDRDRILARVHDADRKLPGQSFAGAEWAKVELHRDRDYWRNPSIYGGPARVFPTGNPIDWYANRYPRRFENLSPNLSDTRSSDYFASKQGQLPYEDARRNDGSRAAHTLACAAEVAFPGAGTQGLQGGDRLGALKRNLEAATGRPQPQNWSFNQTAADLREYANTRLHGAQRTEVLRLLDGLDSLSRPYGSVDGLMHA